ncbi:ribonuclease H-like domain-containing protein [bacterium]|nr:ribonuclease H-like domain-containing protein [bacterium]
MKFYESSLKPAISQHDASQPYDIRQWVEGTEMENKHGNFFLARKSFPLHYRHGVQSLQIFSNLPETIYARIANDENLCTFDPRNTIYLDTETTGLAGGTGTVPFMIGLGYYQEKEFKVEQLFMRDYPEERAILSEFLERLEAFEAIVTYNGKCYDVNLLNSRMILHRMKNPLNKIPHLDLLFTVRRLYKRRLSDCSLGNIEKHILQFNRDFDIPGNLIPGIYFEYLRNHQGHRLSKIFDHNRLDILSLAALTIHTGLVYHDPASWIEHGMDWLSLGRIFESHNLLADAAECYETALQSLYDSENNQGIRFWLGLTYKRMGDWKRAIHQWKQLTQAKQFHIHPFEELAKYYEHQARDYSNAIHWVDRALERLDILSQLYSEIQLIHDRKELMYRRKRLKRKMGTCDNINS